MLKAVLTTSLFTSSQATHSVTMGGGSGLSLVWFGLVYMLGLVTCMLELRKLFRTDTVMQGHTQ